MKILLSAAACSPYQGSEPGVGWTVARGYAERGHSVVAMVYNLFRADLEKAESEGLVPENLRFEYINVDEMPTGSAFKLKFWTWHIYKQYASQVRATAQKLIASQNFDFIQHVTIATWRTPIHLSRLGIPFVFGPLGGAENTPINMLGELSSKAKAFEVIRKFDNLLKSKSPAVKQAISQADLIIAGNNDTKELLHKISGRGDIHSQLVVSMRDEHIARFYNYRETANLNSPLEAFYGGLVEGRKGIAYAIKSIAKAKQMGIRITYNIFASGSEINHLIKLVSDLGLHDMVNISTKPLTGESYVNMLKKCDLFLMPSMRDNASITLMEAMLAGCVPIVANSGGPAQIVEHQKSGFCCNIDSPDALVDDISSKLALLNKDRNLLSNMSRAATNRIKDIAPFAAYEQNIINIVR